MMGLFSLGLYPTLVEMFGTDNLWKNLRDLKDAAIKTYKTPEMRASRNNVFDVFNIVIGTSLNVETYSFFQSSLDGMKGTKHIPFNWMRAAMGGKTTTQDLLLMNYHGMKFSPVPRLRWQNYNRLKAQGLTMQTRIPLADGKVTIQPCYGEKQKKKGRADQAEPKASQCGEGSNFARVLRPSSAERKKTGERSGNPNPLAQLTATPHPQPDRQTKGRERVTRLSRRGTTGKGLAPPCRRDGTALT